MKMSKETKIVAAAITGGVLLIDFWVWVLSGFCLNPVCTRHSLFSAVANWIRFYLN